MGDLESEVSHSMGSLTGSELGDGISRWSVTTRLKWNKGPSEETAGMGPVRHQS